jgi:hypothetical protein
LAQALPLLLAQVAQAQVAVLGLEQMGATLFSHLLLLQVVVGVLATKQQTAHLVVLAEEVLAMLRVQGGLAQQAKEMRVEI